jgi:hypothetical protein
MFGEFYAFAAKKSELKLPDSIPEFVPHSIVLFGIGAQIEYGEEGTDWATGR